MQAVDLFELYVSWLRNNAPMAYDNLSPPATATELDILEEALGQALPDDVKDVLKRHNGQLSVITPAGDHGVPCIPTLNFLSTKHIQEAWSHWSTYWDYPEDLERVNKFGGVFPGAEGIIKPLFTSPGWIPLWADPIDRQYVGLDLDPGPHGKRGQIINFGIDDEIHFICASSFTELLEILLEEVYSGIWQPSESWSGPWFGSPDEQFTNALFKRFQTKMQLNS